MQFINLIQWDFLLWAESINTVQVQAKHSLPDTSGLDMTFSEFYYEYIDFIYS